MTDQPHMQPMDPVPTVERLESLNDGDLQDLCDATDAAIKGGGGFGWVELPAREALERYWQGVLAMPARILLVARLDGVICGTCQLLEPPKNNEAQKHLVKLTTNFIAPWARGHGLAKMLLEKAEEVALEEGFAVVNLDVRETLEEAIALYENMEYVRIGVHPYYARAEGKVLKGYYYYKVIDPKAVEQER
jgi:ribosomal protein S18 acetylase RimI-like enzyme